MLWIWTVVMLPPLTHHAVGGLRIPVPEGWRLESVEGTTGRCFVPKTGISRWR